MDKLTKAQRSALMSRVKGWDSKIEILFRKQLWKQGFRYRKNSGKYFGRPDMVLPKYKTAIFVDSCFWHGCAKHGTFSATRPKFWAKKIAANKLRDKTVNRYYRKLGWSVVRVWEHDLKRRDFQFDFKKIK